MSLMPGNLTIPIAVWNKQPPVHRICNVCMPNVSTLVSGTLDGQLCLWTLKNESEFVPKYLLFGHTTSILCLAAAGDDENCSRFISCAQSGKICLWDTNDGRCLESTHTNYVHTSARAHTFRSLTSTTAVTRILCIGHYSEILVMDPESLQIMFSLMSRVEPDWISAFHVVKPPHKPDIVVGVSNAGMVKIWSLSNVENKTLSVPVYEDESKQVQCFSACALILCRFNPRTMLIVCNKVWQVFDAFDFSLCCSGGVGNKGRLLGGDFTNVDKIIVWASDGCAYLYQLPKNSLKGKALASASPKPGDVASPVDKPICYLTLKLNDKIPVSPCVDAAFAFHHFNMGQGQNQRPHFRQLLVRGSNKGRISVWSVPEVSEKDIATLISLPEMEPNSVQSLQHIWQRAKRQCPGILGCYEELEGNDVTVTTTLYVASRGKLILGRRDGSIIIVSGIRTLSRNFLITSQEQSPYATPLRLLSAHNGTVTCLLYPYEENQRYEMNHLVSGGSDFCVCLSDLNTNTVLHRFCVQAGEILRLSVPPPGCSTKVSHSICSIAADHSVALLGLKDQRCVLLASRHLFPVLDVKWRPLDDFLLVRCEDNTVYVWQIETAHLDRVLSGIVAEEALVACREQMSAALADDKADENGQKKSFSSRDIDWRRYLDDAPPMLIQGVSCNQHDAEFHVVLFNVESLIVSIMMEEGYGGESSPSNQYDSASIQSDLSLSPRFSDFISKAKETAENVLKSGGLVRREGSIKAGTKTNQSSTGSALTVETNLNLEIAHFLLSIVQSWSLEADLDKVCLIKLGLNKPKKPISHGLISKEGHLTLLLPDLSLESSLTEVQQLDAGAAYYARRWTVASSLTTQQLLTLVSLADAFISANGLAFLPEHDKMRRILRRQSSRSTTVSVAMSAGSASRHPSASSTISSASVAMAPSTNNASGTQVPLSSETLDKFVADQSQIRQGWGMLASVHCVLLPDLIQPKSNYRPPRIELLARRWRDRCPQIRDAAQAILLRELNRIGPEGRNALIEKWAPFLPTAVDQSLSILNPAAGQNDLRDTSSLADWDSIISLDKTNSWNQSGLRLSRRNQATSVILLGVIGAEYGQEIARSTSAAATPVSQNQSPPDGFKNSDYGLARATSQSLLELLLQPPSYSLPPFSALRRAAVELIGRGFAVWQPYLDISKVLLALLELCAESERLPQVNRGASHLPMTPEADACQAARNALTLIAVARPPAFITALGKEVTRFNAMSQHQTVHVGSPLVRAKTEILRIMEMITDKMYSDMVDLMIPTGEVLVHCLDTSMLKRKNITEIFPFITKFPMISCCSQSRRLAFGGRNGSVVIHELRIGKSQVIQAHSQAISSCSFSEDGKYLSTYSANEGKLNFWQVSQSFMGMGQSQIKCIKQHSAPTAFSTAGTPGSGATSPVQLPFKAKLIWISPKAVTLMLPNGSEHRFSL